MSQGDLLDVFAGPYAPALRPILDAARFNGPEYSPEHDKARLSDQHIRIRELMLDGRWRSLAEIAALTGDPQSSVSAQLRHLRKERFGSYVVDRRKRGDRKRGLFEYQVRMPEEGERAPQRRRASEAIKELRCVVASLQARVSELETENAQLRGGR